VTAGFPLADAAERALIRERVDDNMLVEAGAGTGKTTVLVERIVHLLRTTDTDVRNVAVITFTEKAAAELAARVRRGVEDALQDANDVERSRLEAALHGLNHAHIETIHAFAASLLRERPIEAGLDPGFEVLDVLPARLEFETQYREWLTAEMAADPPPSALVDALNLGLDPKKIREAAEQVNERRELLPLRPFGRIEVDARAVVLDLAPHVQKLATFVGCAIDEEDEAYQELLRMLAWYADTAARDDDAALRRALVVVSPPGSQRGRKERWQPQGACGEAKNELKAIARKLNAAKNALRANATAGLLEWLQGFVLHYAARRRTEGKADFDDLLIWARDLVKSDAGVRAYFQSKYQRIFVDEFQDTDPLQAELIVSLCAEEPLADDWKRARLRAGALFVVGDPKQSIYRFRRADITMYDDVQRHVFDGEPVRITQNFRSARPIIDWVNDTFSQLFIEEEGVQPRYVDLAFRPDYRVADRVTTLRGAAPRSGGKDASIKAVRTFEAGKIAALINESVRDRSWAVRERDGADRPARYRDIVVLIPSRTDLAVYEDEFARAGVPFRHEGGRTFFTRQEVRELVAVLRAIDDPSDAVAAVGALRSSAFGCSDEDLLLHKHGGGGFDHSRVRQEAGGRTAEALRVLHELSELRHTVTLPELIRAVLDRTRLIEFAMLQPQGEQVAANLLKIIDQARTFSEASGRGLRGFVRWLKDNIERTTDETDAPISEETDDVVRIITIHAAKGLEFPVVILANMAGERRDSTTVVPDRANAWLHLQLGRKDDGFRTPDYDAATGAEQRHSFAEELRLLYVAATRARDRLVVSFIAAKDSDDVTAQAKCLADRLRMAGAHMRERFDLDALALPGGDPPIWRAAIERPVSTKKVEEILSSRETWIADHDALVARGDERLLVQTASALKPEWDAASSFAADAVRRGRAADFGTAVHALLERCSLRLDRVHALAVATSREYGMPERAGEMASVARRAIESAAGKRAMASPRLLLETPFCAPLAGAAGLAEGRIDALFEERDGLVIIDFKTDAVTAKDVDERAEFYRAQALTYAWAAQRATGMPVHEVILLFARPQPAIERSFKVDDAFLAEAEATLRRQPAPV
jgi:ATP-dependent exoDNAse (exonuclease V) beta subunit